jgi:hypothetical protein
VCALLDLCCFLHFCLPTVHPIIPTKRLLGFKLTVKFGRLSAGQRSQCSKTLHLGRFVERDNG